MQGVRRVVGRDSLPRMEENFDGLGRNNWSCRALFSDAAVELVADNCVVGALVLPYLQGSGSRDDQEAF